MIAVINMNHHHPLNIPPKKKTFQPQLPTTANPSFRFRMFRFPPTTKRQKQMQSLFTTRAEGPKSSQTLDSNSSVPHWSEEFETLFSQATEMSEMSPHGRKM